jgi:hypothetical protein
MLHEADDGPTFARRVSPLEDNDEALLFFLQRPTSSSSKLWDMFSAPTGLSRPPSAEGTKTP